MIAPSATIAPRALDRGTSHAARPVSAKEPTSSKETLRLRLYALMLASDICSVTAGFVLANVIRFGNPLAIAGLQTLTIILPIFVVLAFNARAYTLEVLDAPRHGIFRALKAFGLSAAAIIGVIFYMKVSADFSRLVLAVGTLSSAILLAVSRKVVGEIVGRRARWNFVNEVLLVDDVHVLPSRGEVVLHARAEDVSPDANDPATFDRMGQLLRHCDRVILACPPHKRAAWARTLKGIGVDVEVLAPELDQLGAIKVRRVDNRSTLLVASGPLGVRERVTKRALDLAVAVPALILLSPLMVVVAVAIKLDSRGPVLFHQQRVGRGNRIFSISKFRSMRVDGADSTGIVSASHGDARTTRIGRFIRRTSIDELPQLLNVVAGSMSIAGPRPHALGSTAGDTLFWHIDDRYWERGAVKPGITGLAQIRGYRGATVTHADLTNRLQADLEYVTDWTIWRDIRIMVRTVGVLTHKNAF